MNPDHRRCPFCGGAGPRARWTARTRRIMSAAVSVNVAGLVLPFAAATVAEWTGADPEGALGGMVYAVGFLVFVPAILLIIPVCLLAVAVNAAGRRAYRDEPLCAAWDVRAPGQVHAVCLPAGSVYSMSDHAWVDGARVPLAWAPQADGTTRATLEAADLRGTLSAAVDRPATAVGLGASIGLAILFQAAPVSGGAPMRFGLEVPGAGIDEVPIENGARGQPRADVHIP